MKKILIALPLVLIMILTMIPVMAAEKALQVPVTIYAEPNHSGTTINEVKQISLDEKILADADKFKAAVEKLFEGYKMPDDRKYDMKVTVVAAKEEVKPVVEKYTVKTAKEDFGSAVVDQGNLKDEDFLLQTAVDKIEAAHKASDENDPDAKKVTLDDNDKTTEDKAATRKQLPGEAPVAASAAVVFTPKCFSEAKETTKEECPELCEFITIKAVNIANNKVVKELKYEVFKNRPAQWNKMVNHFIDNFIKPNNLQVVNNWFGAQDIYYPGLIEDCEIRINVLPVRMDINIQHHLYTCCRNDDGTLSYKFYKGFYEQFQTVDFIKYHSELLIDHTKAKEFAQTRLERLNAKDFVFQYAEFDDGINLDGYMTGKVYDLNGNLVELIENDEPWITLVYYQDNCVETEEKVDNAQVNAGQATTNQAPAQQLPATGAKDVTAFFMSAVALLGLGIFFAKKH